MNTAQVLVHLEGRIRTVGRNFVTCYYAYAVWEIVRKQFSFYHAMTAEANNNCLYIIMEVCTLL
jgi:hypothetical protein